MLGILLVQAAQIAAYAASAVMQSKGMAPPRCESPEPPAADPEVEWQRRQARLLRGMQAFASMPLEDSEVVYARDVDDSQTFAEALAALDALRTTCNE